MSGELDQDYRVMAILTTALRLPTLERKSYLQIACAEDQALFQEVAGALEWEERMGEFMRRPLVSLKDLERPFRAGTVVGERFEIIREVGEGGMGVVYEAFDQKRQQRIAIKSAKLGYRRLLSPELESALRVRHPNICLVNEIHSAATEYGEVDFLTMEFLDGRTLAARLAAGGRLDHEEAQETARQLCSALAEAHRSGVIHRDLKSANVILCRSPEGSFRTVITDFGLATGPTFDPRDLAGTPGYMAPELWKGDRPSPASDIYALGVILYEMVTGEKPFSDTNTESRLTAPPAAPSTRSKTLDPLWDAAILPCLHPSPGARPKDAKQVLALLERRPLWKRQYPRMAAAAILTSVLISALGYVDLQQRAGISTRIERLVRVTNSGNVAYAACSPDGNYIAYAKKDGGKQGLRVIQVRTNTDMERVSPADVQYTGITISRDGFIYYVARENEFGTLYRLPLSGGTSKSIVYDVDSPISLAPDEKRFVFLRDDPQQNTTSLILRNLKQNTEKRLVTLKWPEYFRNAPIWSPDGSSVVVAQMVGDPLRKAMDLRIAAVPVDSNAQSVSLSEPWYWVGKPVWLHNGHALGVAAADTTSKRGQIMQIAWPSGRLSPILRDTADYRDLSATEDARKIVALQFDRESDLWIAPIRSGEPYPLTSAGRFYGVSWTPNGKLISQAETSERSAVLSVDTKTKEQHELVQEDYVEKFVVASPDGKYLVHVANRDGVFRLWRSDTNGEHLKQLTSQTAAELRPSFTPDGRSVVYTSAGAGFFLWQIPIEGGDSRHIGSQSAKNPAVSPDGKFVACDYYLDDSRRWTIAVLDLATGRAVRFFPDLPVSSDSQPLSWSIDGKYLLYVKTDADQVSNIWGQPLDGSAPRPWTSFRDAQIFAFAPSPDGKALAVVRGRSRGDAVLMDTAQ